LHFNTSSPLQIGEFMLKIVPKASLAKTLLPAGMMKKRTSLHWSASCRRRIHALAGIHQNLTRKRAGQQPGDSRK